MNTAWTLSLENNDSTQDIVMPIPKSPVIKPRAQPLTPIPFLALPPRVNQEDEFEGLSSSAMFMASKLKKIGKIYSRS